MADDAFLWDTPRPSRTDIYVTLREAEEMTGVKASTLRGWARKGAVPSQLDRRPDGTRRLIDLTAAAARAARSDPPPPPPHSEHVPEGHLLVPLDAWEKMLLQLGNLHEAGREMAEARERAAKAETEATFLRDRLADLRAERDRLIAEHTALRERYSPPPPPPEVAAPEEAAPEVERPRPRWKRIYQAWRGRS